MCSLLHEHLEYVWRSTPGQVLRGGALPSRAPVNQAQEEQTTALVVLYNSSGMLSPSADQHSGRTACNSKEVLFPFTGHCCGQTTMQDSYAKRGDAVSLTRPMLWSDCNA